jgi:hypothetical protein
MSKKSEAYQKEIHKGVVQKRLTSVELQRLADAKRKEREAKKLD